MRTPKVPKNVNFMFSTGSWELGVPGVHPLFWAKEQNLPCILYVRMALKRSAPLNILAACYDPALGAVVAYKARPLIE